MTKVYYLSKLLIWLGVVPFLSSKMLDVFHYCAERDIRKGGASVREGCRSQVRGKFRAPASNAISNNWQTSTAGFPTALNFPFLYWLSQDTSLV
jgi:hypothetical protein